MRELNFATEQSIVEAYEELQENYDMDLGFEMDRNTEEMLNGMLLVDAERQDRTTSAHGAAAPSVRVHFMGAPLAR